MSVASFCESPYFSCAVHEFLSVGDPEAVHGDWLVACGAFGLTKV